jgi:hypothetical protein
MLIHLSGNNFFGEILSCCVIQFKFFDVNIFKPVNLIYFQIFECYSDKCTPSPEVPSYSSCCEQKEKEYA